jgi:CheY-like chemotaxis protein
LGSADDHARTISTMPTRIGEPQQIGGSDRLPTWRVKLSEDASPEWRRLFLEAIHADALFAGQRIAVEGATIVFEVERPSFALACEHIDQWIARANGEPAPALPTHALPTILVVDDDPEIGPLAEDILETEGYTVVQTTDPMEAIRLARQGPEGFDLLLVDLVMPLMDGRELARRVQGHRPAIKVILMSGYEVSGIKETGWPFVKKPFAVETLRRAVAAALARRERRA